MAPIATTVVSYEHTTPLQRTDDDAIRAECRRGFEAQSDDSVWTVPTCRLRDCDMTIWGYPTIDPDPGLYNAASSGVATNVQRYAVYEDGILRFDLLWLAK